MGHGARWLRPLLAVAVVLSGLTISGVAHAETVTTTVFSDDFDGGRFTSVDTTKWSGNTRYAWVDGDGHASLDSQLFTASTFSQSSGHVSARIRPGRTSGARRILGVLGAAGQPPDGQAERLGDDDVHGWDFHTYAIDWTRTAFVWSVDGRQVLRLTRDNPGEPFRVALNLSGAGEMLIDSVTVAVRLMVTPAPAWKAFTTYEVGDRVTYKGATYRVKAQHTALPGWQPGLVPALFEKI
jgi:hypothetical protein